MIAPSSVAEEPKQQQDFDDHHETPWFDARIRHEDDYEQAVVTYLDEEDSSDNGDDDEEPTETFSFRFCHHDDEETTTTRTTEIALKGVAVDSNQIYKSTGMTVWRSAQYLCDYILKNQKALFVQTTTSSSTRKKKEGLRVLELGSGLGLCGILTHRVLLMKNAGEKNDEQDEAKVNDSSNPNKSHVFLTDGDTDTLKQLRQNVHDNVPPSTSSCSTTTSTKTIHHDSKNFARASDDHQISCHQLLWGRETARRFRERHATRNSGHEDTNITNGDDDSSRFQVILASDVIYTNVVIVPLFATVQELLHLTRGVFLMAYESKRKVHVDLNDILEQAQRVGLEYECIDQDDSNGIFVWKFYKGCRREDD